MKASLHVHLIRNLLLLAATCLLKTAEAQVCSSAPAGATAWWEFQNVPTDVLGVSTLTLFNGATYGGGKVGQGLSLDGVNDYARVNANAKLNLGTNSGLTIEFWFKCANAAGVGTFVEWNNGSIGAHMATSSGNPRDMFANIVDTSGVSHQVSSGPNVLSNGVFQHVAFTYDRTSGEAAMYLGGSLIRSTNLGIFTPQTTYPFYVGNRPAGPVSGTYFSGIIDELTLYGRVMTSNEVIAIYLASAAGKCAGPAPLAILTQPQSITVGEGGSANFNVTAQGAPPLSYAWHFNTSPMPGQTNAQLMLTNVQLSQAGNYFVMVSDATGSLASAVATLTVTQLPLAILTQPQSMSIQESNNASFSVIAQGRQPLQYQWRFNDVALTNQNQATLTLTNVQLAQAGGYSVAVSDSSGSITSAVATLTVTPTPSCGSLAVALTAWWPFENSGTDVVGNAVLTLINGPTYGPGEVAQGLVLDGVNDYASASPSAGLNIGTNAGMSVEMWIKPANAAKVAAAILEWNNGNIGAHLATSTGANRDFFANLVDTSGVSHQIFSGANALADNVFQHVAVTYDKASGLAASYVNGIRLMLTNLGSFTPQTSYPLYVGLRPSGSFSGIYFPGVIDEPGLYNRALTSTEVQAIFLAGTDGKCSGPHPLAILAQPQNVTVQESNTANFSVVAQGTPPIRYQWQFNTAPLAGRTNATLSLPNVQLAQAGDYAVTVTDATGSVTSATVTLTVIQPLAIQTPPQNVMAMVGGGAAFSVIARGTPPLAFQWLFNGAILPGQNSSNLFLNSLTVGQAGRYSVVVSNFSGSLTSAPATLTILSSTNPVITEFMAENDGSLLDEDGKASDWIELFNPGPTVNLEDWFLTDNATNLTKWRFPATNLAANGYLLVFASGNDRRVPGANLHTNFKLNNAGGYLALVMPDGFTIASEWTNYPPQRANVSYGLSGGPVFFLTPTPGAANNNSGVLGFVADTKFSTNRGFFFAPFNLAIYCTTPGATIVYTTNGNIPTLASGLLIPPPDANTAPTGTIQIAATKTLRTATFKDGWVSTDVDTETYILPPSVAAQTRPPGASATWIEDPPGNGGTYPADFTVDNSVVSAATGYYCFTNALTAIPTISLVTPMDGVFGPVNGIYTRPLMEGTNWERATSVEMIYPDGHEGFHVGAGVQIHGAVSELPHATPKHPLRILFREEYGMNKFDYPLFPGPVNKFDQLVLRACSTDSWPMQNSVDFLWYNYDATYLRDQWMRDAHLAMGQTAARGSYVQLYINGVYWGLYNLAEKLNDTFFADRLGGQKEEYDVVTDFTGVAVSGTRTMWTQLLSLSGQAASNTNIFTQVQGLNPDGTRNTNYPVLINMDNFIDYMALHIHAAAIDWPGRNWWAARRTGPLSDGFHFFTWDQEVAIDRLDRDSTGTWGVSPTKIETVYEPNTVGQVYDGLRRDQEFKVKFGDHVQKHMFNGGVLTLQSNVARWAARSAEIDQAIVGESARWGDAAHSPAYNRSGDWLGKSNFMVNTYFPSNAQFALKRFRNVGLYPSLGAPDYSQFGGNVPQGFALGITHTNAAGIIYYTLDGSDPRLRGGAPAGSALTYSSAVPINSPLLVRARVRNGTNWSALVEAVFTPPQDFSKLRISEIMYNPPKVGDVDGDEFEFLELMNTGSTALDLSGLVFSNGINFTFTNGTLLGAGQYFVLARNSAQFAARYPGAPLRGIYTGKLDNAGERILFNLPSGAVVFDLTYDNAAPWPTEADNTGLSLQVMSTSQPATNPANWIAGPPTPGGPPPWQLVDSDGDGMPDGWETLYHLDPEQNDAAVDTDHDGLSNWQEFIAGTDPTNPNDRLRLETTFNSTASGAAVVKLRFDAVSNKTYTVVYRNSASGTGWTNLVHIAAVPTNRVVTVTNTLPAGLSSRFYLLTTPRLP